MQTRFSLKLATAMLLAVVAYQAKATVFFSDTFTSGSTLNSLTPANPTATSTAYQVASAKAWTQTNISPNQLRFGIANSTGGHVQLQALFSTNAKALVLPGDFVQLTIVFTNFSGLLTEAGQLGFGLYNSEQVKPLAGGCNGTVATSTTLSGGAQGWQGYVAQINYTGANSRIMTRPTQSAVTTGNNQDLISSGSGNYSYTGPATVGATSPSTVSLKAGQVCTNVLTITYVADLSVAITNVLSSTNGVLANFGGVAVDSTFVAGGFDGLAIGYYDKSNPNSNTIDIASIEVTGSVTAITAPPIITLQPVDVTVPNGASCFFAVDATGYSMTYQWHRNGTNLQNGGNISGATSKQLIISPVGTGDVCSGANGYYCTVTGAGPFSTNSEIHSLALGTAKNLVYSSGPWDLNTSASWVGGLMFNFGDAVTFDDTSSGTVTLSNSYLSASSVTVSHTGSFYTFSGTGSFAGPGSLLYKGSGLLTINNINTYTGGTIISNATANLRLQNQSGLGTGPVRLAKAGAQLELLSSGSASSGIGDVVVQDDATILTDGTGTFAAVILGNLSGTAGKVLLINPSIASTNSRVRVYGTNTVCKSNLVINDGSNGDPANSLALYGGTTLAPYNASGSQTYNGVISGVGGVVERANGLTVLNAQNTYSGGTYPTTGSIAFGVDSTPTSGTVTSGPIGVGPLYVSPEVGSGNGSGTVQAANGARTIANPIQYPTSTNNQTLIIGGTNNLTFTGPFALNGQTDSVTNANRTVQVNNTGVTVFSGVISDAGLGFGLIKTGTNALYINNSGNSYTGPTTVSAGLLTGNGKIPGLVTVATNASIGGGSAAAIGTLAVGGNLNLALGAGGFFRVNPTGLLSDQVSVTGNITNLSTNAITITNINTGTPVAAGNKFYLFNKAVTGGTNLTVTGGLPAGLGWSNSLAVDGSIVAIVSATDLAISMSGPASTNPVSVYSYTLTVTNLGPAAAPSVVVTNTLPAGVTFGSATSPGVNNAGIVSWALGSLNANQGSNLTLTVTAPTYGSLTNKVTVSLGLTDPAMANNTAQLVTTIVPVTNTVPYITNSISGTNLTLQWPLNQTGFTLQAQTNTLATGLTTNWAPVAGSTTTNQMILPVVSTNGSVFYRLKY
jgi:uncharacterized repeat protein (TIGR01451 family)